LFDVLVFDGLYFGLANLKILILAVDSWSDEEEALHNIIAQSNVLAMALQHNKNYTVL
jgi:hypothetical protein